MFYIYECSKINVRIRKIRYSKRFLVRYESTEPWMSNFGAAGLLFNPSYHGNAGTIKISSKSDMPDSSPTPIFAADSDEMGSASISH